MLDHKFHQKYCEDHFGTNLTYRAKITALFNTSGGGKLHRFINLYIFPVIPSCNSL